MFSKILIANRGEIACRVIATAQRLGIATVAVYSDADASAKHVAMADEAVHIGPPPVAESYMQAARILEAAKKTGAEAIHPGYGFLSENPDFADAVAQAGLVFIGPPAPAIRAMGLKDAAKALMQEAGVPVVPGYHGADQDPDILEAEAAQIGYPVLIKARAGGGGKGMRLVERAEDFRTALEGAQREGAASFGDPACLIEKYITQPRHIEIQVMADGHGNVVHLFERDCSLQRRHQKVIEEAPAPDMPVDMRAAMGQAAVEAARAIGYQGAGTVEFIVDGSDGLRADGFWFMEMNTRLQVEHPVSEAITGLDFVELQLRVANGEPLPVRQEDLSIDGWAFEARVYAENVPRGFLPSIGTLEHLSFPDAAEFANGPVRVDSGVRQGDAISPFYDPMIAKVIVHGADRAAALTKLSAALAECHVAGTVTNIAFLSALASHQGFARGEVDTGLIARDLDALTAQDDPPEVVTALASLAALGFFKPRDLNDPWDALAGWRHWSDAKQYATLDRDGTRIERQVVALGSERYRVEGGDEPLTLTIRQPSPSHLDVDIDGHRTGVDFVITGSTVSIFTDGQTHEFSLPDMLAGAEEEDGGDVVVAPMPGLVKLVSCEAGQQVAKGDALIVLEAMKMEHTLTAPRDGNVEEVLTSEGSQVTDGTILVRLVGEDG